MKSAFNNSYLSTFAVGFSCGIGIPTIATGCYAIAGGRNFGVALSIDAAVSFATAAVGICGAYCTRPNATHPQPPTPEATPGERPIYFRLRPGLDLLLKCPIS